MATSFGVTKYKSDVNIALPKFPVLNSVESIIYSITSASATVFEVIMAFTELIVSLLRNGNIVAHTNPSEASVGQE